MFSKYLVTQEMNNLKKVYTKSKKNSKKKTSNRILGGEMVPRPIFNGYPKKNAKANLKFVYGTRYTAIVPWDNVNIRNSTFETISGISAVYAGMTILQASYTQATVLKIRGKVTIVNEGNNDVCMQLCPIKSPSADHSSTFRDRRNSPECVTTVVSGRNSGYNNQKTLVHTADVSKLWGYNISSTNNNSFIANLGSAAPAVISSLELVVNSLDSTTVVDYTVYFECHLEVLLQSPVQTFS